MRWCVHDLLRLGNPDDLKGSGPVPMWVNAALSRTPWVVVRRAPTKGGLVPIGVRGDHRSERFASFIDPSSISESVPPEALSSSQTWQQVDQRRDLPPMRALAVVHAILRTSDLCWGPVGSVGFELASGVPAAHRASDLDLIVRLSDFLIPWATTQKLLEVMHGTEIRVDLLLETGEGAISFLEYIGNQPDLVLRSINGPSLIQRSDTRLQRRVGTTDYADSEERKSETILSPFWST
jgi:phosphoribosyl-dephospho-CoA transferase